MRFRRKVQRIARERAEFARKSARKNRRALDNAGIAVARLLAGGIMLVDEHDGAPALLQMQRGGDADHPRAENDCILAHGLRLAPPTTASQQIRATSARPRRPR